MKAKRENVPSYCDREGQWPWGGGDLDLMDILDVSGVSKRWRTFLNSDLALLNTGCRRYNKGDTTKFKSY